MSKSFYYKCHTCEKEYHTDDIIYLCPVCSPEKTPKSPLKGVLKVLFDYKKIREEWDKTKDIFAFSAIDKKHYPEIAVGNTPFQKISRLGKYLNLSNFYVKNDSLNPTGSLKDRASYMLVAESNRQNIDVIVASSTGNAACALAAICADAGKKAVIFVPKRVPTAKLTQIRLFGAEIEIVDGNYDDAYRETLLYATKNNCLNRNTAYHPFTIEGKKTVSLEIFIQNNYKAPDNIFVPVGDGVIIAGVYKGFYDLKQAGLIEKIPRLFAVQAKYSNAIYDLFNGRDYDTFNTPDTLADSISIVHPANGLMAIDYIRDSKGDCIAVSDDEIMEAQKIFAEYTGIYAEPAASASFAGLLKYKEKLNSDEQTVLLITGNGLKDVEATIKYNNYK